VNRKKALLLIVIAILLLVAAFGYGKNDKDSVGIRGEITELLYDNEGKVAAVLVEGKVESDTSFDKARVGIAKDTVILKTNGQELEPEELQEGMKVEVVFQGPIAESYPVQGRAKAIRVLD